MQASIIFFDDNKDNVNDMKKITGVSNSHLVAQAASDKSNSDFGMTESHFDIVKKFCKSSELPTPKIAIFDWDHTISVKEGYIDNDNEDTLLGGEDRKIKIKDMFELLQYHNVHVIVLTANPNCNTQTGRQVIPTILKRLGLLNFEDENLICSFQYMPTIDKFNTTLLPKSNALVRKPAFTNLIGKMPLTGDDVSGKSISELKDKITGGKKRKTRGGKIKRKTKRRRSQRRPHA